VDHHRPDTIVRTVRAVVRLGLVCLLLVEIASTRLVAQQSIRPEGDSPDSAVFLNELRASWESRTKRLETIECSWTEHRVYPPGSLFPPEKVQFIGFSSTGHLAQVGVPPVEQRFEIPARLTLSSDLMRYTTSTMLVADSGTIAPQSYVSSFDGNSSKSLFGTGGSDRRPTGTIWNDSRNTDFSSVDVHAWMAYARPLLYRGRTLDFSQLFVRSQQAEIDGSACVLVVYGDTDLWVDPACGHVARRITERRADGRIAHELSIRYVEHDQSLWRPSGWELTSYLANPLKPEFASTTRTEVTSFEVGSPMAPDAFRLDFPEDAEVYDHRARSFVKESTSRPFNGGKPVRTDRIVWLLLGNGVLILVLAVVWVCRRRRR
jgi:hypothetical protein